MLAEYVLHVSRVTVYYQRRGDCDQPTAANFLRIERLVKTFQSVVRDYLALCRLGQLFDRQHLFCLANLVIIPSIWIRDEAIHLTFSSIVKFRCKD